MNRTLILSAIVVLLASQSSFSQSLDVLSVGSNATSVTAKAFSFSETGIPETIAGGELSATIDGVTATVVAAPQSPPNVSPLSIVLCIDGSESMGEGTQSKLSAAISAANGLVQTLRAADEIALLNFGDRPTLLHGLTNNAQTFENSIIQITPRGGSDYNALLTDATMGAITHLRNGQNKRVIVIVTDGSTRFNSSFALSQARAFNTIVYVVGVGTNVSTDLEELAYSTGGGVIVASNAELTNSVRACLADARGDVHTRLTITPTDACTNREVVSITRAQTVRTSPIPAFPFLRPTLEWSQPGIDFGNGGPRVDRTITLTARGGSITVSSASLTAVGFQIVSPNLNNLSLAENESVEVTIRYNESSRGIFGALQLTHTGCQVDDLYLRGGSLSSGDVLEITSPAGGEVFNPGELTTIRWTNVLPQDIVRLDYSTDAGVSWNPIVENASGLSYEWSAGPFATTGGKIRAQRTALPEGNDLRMRGHVGSVLSVTRVPNTANIVTGGQDGTVRLWSATTGKATSQLGTHAGWVWSIDAHPRDRVVASGGHDGSVRLFDVESGKRLGTFLADSRVWAVRFSPSGNQIAVGTENSISLVSYPDLNLIRKHTAVGERFEAVDFAPDENFIAVSSNKRVTTRRVATLEETAVYPLHNATVYSVRYAQNGQSVYSAGADNKVHRWSAQNGTPILESVAQEQSLNAIDLSADGTTCIAASSDGTVKEFATNSLDLKRVYSGHGGSVNDVVYDSDSSFTTSSSDATSRRVVFVNAVELSDESSSTFEVRNSTLVPGPVIFGRVVNDSQKEMVATILTNDGANPVVIHSARIVSGKVGLFKIDEGQFPIVLDSKANLDVAVTYRPEETGIPGGDTAIILIETGLGNFQSVALGEGINPELSYSKFLPNPESRIIDFGRIQAGLATRDTTISIRLDGAGSVRIESVLIRGEQADEFSIVDGGGQFTISPTLPRTIRLRFSPDLVGAFAAQLVLNDNNGARFVVRLYGEGATDARVFSSATRVLFSTEPCNAQRVTQKVPVSNNGASTLLFLSVLVGGANSDEFEVVSAPASLAPSETDSIEVAFNPTSNGVKDANLAITTNGVGSNGGVIQIPIFARQDTASFELSVNNIVFNSVIEGETATQQVNLINTGTSQIQWDSPPIDLGDFVITAIEPAVTAPGAQSAVSILFKGGTVNTNYSTSYVFTEGVCGSSDTLSMSATVREYIGCTIDIDSVGADIGETVNVGIRVNNRVNFDRTSVTSIGARLSFNGTILTPTASSNLGTFLPNGTRVVDINIPVVEENEIATSLQFTTTWGNDTGAVIRVDSVWVNDTILVRNNPGYVRLNDLCREGGPRLFIHRENSSGLRASVIPHPVVESSTIELKLVESGLTHVSIFDVEGKEVLNVVDKHMPHGTYFIPLDAADFEAGAYVLVVETPTQRFVNRISVVR